MIPHGWMNLDWISSELILSARVKLDTSTLVIYHACGIPTEYWVPLVATGRNFVDALSIMPTWNPYDVTQLAWWCGLRQSLHVTHSCPRAAPSPLHPASTPGLPAGSRVCCHHYYRILLFSFCCACHRVIQPTSMVGQQVLPRCRSCLPMNGTS